MVLVKKWPFFKLLFWKNIGQENVFYDILERKNAFLGYKNKKFKKSKNWHFSTGVNPWARSIRPKFRPVRPKKDDHLKRWTRFLKLFRLDRTDPLTFGPKFPKSLVEWIALHSFGPKMAIFPNVFFRQYRPRKCLLRYSRTKKRLSKL